MRALMLLSLCALCLTAIATREKCACAHCGQPGGPEGKVGNDPVAEPYTKARPFPPKGDAHVRNDTSVMVLLSAYRDPRCAQTTANVYLRAEYPERMHVGIVQQKQSTGDEFDCVALYCEVMKANGHPECPYLENIQVVTVDSHLSQGPIWARGLGEPMVKPEHQFCMQVDAHVDFMHGYDTALMKMWAMTENEYGVLSTYVGNLGRDLSKKGEVLVGHPYYQVPVICGTIKGGHGVMRNKQAFGATCLDKPLLSFTWAAGWSFAKCHFERNAPNDPQMGGMFDGEEFGRQIRAWTKGYDTYTPHRPIVFHDYNHSHKFQRGREGTWNSNHNNLNEAVARYFAMVQAPNHKDIDLKGWGLGNRRTLDQFIEFSGLDPRNSKDIDADQKCGKLEYVPFEEDQSLLDTQMPELPFPLPGSMAEAASFKDHMPVVFEEYIEAALFMRGMLSDSSPEISHERQMEEFGNPPNQFWQDIIEKIRNKQNSVHHNNDRDRIAIDAAQKAQQEVQKAAETPEQVLIEQTGPGDHLDVAEEIEFEPNDVTNNENFGQDHKGWTLLELIVVMAAFYGGLEFTKNVLAWLKNRKKQKHKAYIA